MRNAAAPSAQLAEPLHPTCKTVKTPRGTLGDVGNLTNYKRCRDCGITREEAGRLSRRGFCEACGIKRQIDAVREMATRRGPTFEKWEANRGAAGRPSTPNRVGGSSPATSSTKRARKSA